MGTYSNLHQNTQNCCNKSDIKFFLLCYRAARDGNLATISANDDAQDIEAPDFDVNLNRVNREGFGNRGHSLIWVIFCSVLIFAIQ